MALPGGTARDTCGRGSGAMRTLPVNNPEHAAHALKAFSEQALLPAQFQFPGFELLPCEHGDFLPCHGGSYFNTVPAYGIREAFRPPVERAGIVNENIPVFKARNVSRPAHTGVDTEPPFVRREACEVRSDKAVFRLSHIPSVTPGGGKVKA